MVDTVFVGRIRKRILPEYKEELYKIVTDFV